MNAFNTQDEHYSGRTVAVVLQVACISILLLPISILSAKMTEYLWPGLHYDAVLYATIVLNYATNSELVYSVYSPALINDPSGLLRGHGLLSYVIWSHIFGVSTFESYFHAISQATQISALSFAFLIWISARQLGWFSVLLAVAGAWSLFAGLIQIQGRPEHMIPLVLILTELIVYLVRMDWRLRIILRGTGLGLVGALSPAPAVVYMSGLLLYKLGRSDLRGFLWSSALLIATSGVVWFAVTSLSYDGQVLQLLMNSAGDIDRSARSEIPGQWLFNPNTPYLGLLYALFAGLFFWTSFSHVQRQSSCVSWVLFLVLGLNLLYWVYLCGFKNPPVNYRLIALMPLAILFLVSAAEKRGLLNKSHPKLLLPVQALLASSLLVLSIGGGRFVWAATEAMAQSGVNYADAKRTFNRVKETMQPDERIGIDQWGKYTDVVLDSPPWRTLSLPHPDDEQKIREMEGDLGLRVRYYLKTCKNAGSPAERIGPFLRVHGIGVEECSCRTGYGFILYERDRAGGVGP